MSVGQGFIDAASIFLSGYRNLIHKYQRVQFTLVFHIWLISQSCGTNTKFPLLKQPLKISNPMVCDK